MEARELTEKVRVHHFHEWCGEMLRTYHVEVKGGPEPLYERQVTSVIDGVERGFIPRGQYGALLIDEGHDFEPEWLKLVVQMVDPATDSLLLLYDDAQSIYRKPAGLGFSLSSVGIKAAGRTTILRLNYRNSREILKFAYDFAHESLGPKKADEDHIPLIEPESAGIGGARPVFRVQQDRKAELDYAQRCVQRWLEKGVPPREIAVIGFKGWQGSEITRRLQRNGIDPLWMGTSAGKRAYDPTVDRVTVVLAPSSKGLEFQSVVVIGAGDLDDREEHLTSQTRPLYVALTRAKKQLAVAASRRNKFVERLEAAHATAV